LNTIRVCNIGEQISKRSQKNLEFADMTNMEGWGTIFASIFIGIPLLCLVIISSYLVHRRNLKNSDETVSVSQDQSSSGIAEIVREIFLNPDLYFMRVTGNRTNLWQPFLLITAGGIILVISSFSGLGIIFLPFILFPLYIFWFLNAILVFAVTVPFKGEGPISTTLQNSGYAMGFGLIVIDLLCVIPFNFLYHPFEIGPPVSPSTIAIPTAVVTIAVLIICFWTGTLMSFGLRHARRIPHSRAVIAVVIPFILYLLLASGKIISVF
jgi:hypothetical protein